MLNYTPATITHITNELHKTIVGQDEVIEQILVAILAEGHALVEGVPGTAKTLTVKSLAQIIGARFSRIQFTPDLMPSDITGNNVFNMQTSEFSLRPGPIFTDILLADEINRTPPKTQSALLEAMEERQTTIDGKRYRLSPLFTVLATENPIEYEGTYPLPEAQLDRFLLKILIDYPAEDAELEIVSRWDAGFNSRNLEQIEIQSPSGCRGNSKMPRRNKSDANGTGRAEIYRRTRPKNAHTSDDSLRRKSACFGRITSLFKSTCGNSRTRFSYAGRRARRCVSRSASSPRFTRRSRTRRCNDRRGNFGYY